MPDQIPIPVSCCIIRKEGRILVAQKSSGVWEFPGGKLEQGESMLACAEREVLEEMGISVRAVKELTPHRISTAGGNAYDLVPVVCDFVQGELVLHEHADAQWVEEKNLYTVDWGEADRLLLATYFSYQALAQ